MQTTPSILMIRPARFAFNTETAVNNSFQSQQHETDVHTRALSEFNAFVQKLQDENIDVLVVDDTPDPHTPDSIFPNNWISFHEGGVQVIYPMFALNRRRERKESVLHAIHERFNIKKTIDYSGFEQQNKYLEGTGSMVLDREKKIAYACLSPRTDSSLFSQFCADLGYHEVSFRAVDTHGREIYHTNVMMCVASDYVVVCLDSIVAQAEKDYLINTIKNSGKEIIPITLEQMNSFAGNMLQLQTRHGEKLLVMSEQACTALTPDQLARLQSFNRIVHSPLRVIEANGGGSARCMIAEIHLVPKGRSV